MADSMEKRQRERKRREKKQQKAIRRRERLIDGPGVPIPDGEALSRFELLPEYSLADELTEVEGKYRGADSLDKKSQSAEGQQDQDAASGGA